MARVLVIDDSKTAIEFVRSALGQDGHVVEELLSYVELAGLLKANPPDLIMLDLQMPAISGRSFGRLIRAQESRSIPIIIYSSRPAEERDEVVKEIGAFAHVEKSISSQQLRRVINHTLIKSILASI